MNPKLTIAIFVTIAVVTGCATSKHVSPPSPSASRSDPSVERKTTPQPARDLSWANPSGLGKAKEAQLHRELGAAVDHWREAYARREVEALEKLLADEFTVSFSGKTLTRSNAV